MAEQRSESFSAEVGNRGDTGLDRALADVPDAEDELLERQLWSQTGPVNGQARSYPAAFALTGMLMLAALVPAVHDRAAARDVPIGLTQ